MVSATLRPLAMGLLAVILSGACATSLDPGRLAWREWREPSLGLSLSVPRAWKAHSYGEAYSRFVRSFRTQLVVRCVGEAEGRARGLWFGTPSSGPASLAGIAGDRYDYTHWDGPFGSRMVAYVLPWRGRWLALEFATGEELDPVQAAVLASLRLDPP